MSTRTIAANRSFGVSRKSQLASTAMAIAIVAGLAAAPAQAQTTAAPAEASENVGLDDIIVTAQKRSQAISQVPLSVQAVGPLQIGRLGAVDTTALTQLSPSITFRPGYSANSSSFAIRGVTSVGINGGIQPSTAVVIDGVPLYKSGEVITDFSDVQGIEILRGPQSTLFGKNSSAGVISINTATPGREFAGRVQAGITNDSEWFGNAMLNVPVSETIQVRLTGYYRNQEPLVKNRGIGSNLLGAQTYGFGAKVKFELSDKLDFLLSGNVTNRRGSYGQAFTFIPLGGALTGAQAGVTGIAYAPGNLDTNLNGTVIEKADTTSVIGQFDWRISDTTTLTSITGFRVFNADNYNDVDGTPAGSEIGQPYTATTAVYFLSSVNNGFPRQPDKARYGSQEIRLHYEGDRADLVTGIFYQAAKNRVKTNTGIAGPLRAAAGDFNQYYTNNFTDVTIKNDSASIFADLSYKLTSDFTVFAGARYTHESISNDYSKTFYFVPRSLYDPITGLVSDNPATVGVNEALGTTTAFAKSDTVDNISGRAGIQWRPSEGQNYYASYNRGYKGPAVNGGTDASLAVALTGPEIAEAFEVGTKQRLFANRLSFSLSVYSQKIQGVQQSSLLPGTISSVLSNAGDLKSKGAEFEFQALVATGLRLSGGLSYTDAKYSGNGEVDCYPGQTVAQGCVPLTSNPAQFHQFLAGQTAINAPKWRYNAAVDYEAPIQGLGKLDFNISWIWSSSAQYALNQNPTTIEPSHGFLNASVTLVTDKGWEVQVFGRNLTNEFYYGTRTFATVFGTAGYPARDVKRYGGISVKYSF